MDRVCFAGLFTLTFLVPWDNTVAFQGLGSLARLAGAGTLGLSAIGVIAAGSVRRLHAFHVIAAAFVVWSVSTLLWTVNVETTLERTTTYAQVAALAWLIWQHARTEERQRLLLRAYVLGAFVPALDTLKNYLQGVTIGGSSTRFAASGFNANEVAIILVLAIPMAWYLMLLTRNRIWVFVYACFLPLSMLVVFLTGSRGAFLAALVALLLIPWSLSRLSALAKLGAIVLLVGAIVVATAMAPSESLERLQNTAGEIAEGDLTGRGVLWVAAVQLFLDHPLAGVGAGSFLHVSQPLGRPLSPHQTFLEVLTGQGLIGLGLFVGMFAAAFGAVRRMAGLQRKFWTVLAITLFIGLLPRTFDYRKPVWFLLGIAAAQSALVRRQESSLITPGQIALTSSASAA